MDQQENREKRLCREFLDFKGIDAISIKTLSEFCPDYRKAGISGPDVLADCIWNDKRLRVGIELTEYQVDRNDRGSLTRRFDATWKRLLCVLRKTYFPQYPELTSFYARIGLKADSPPTMSGVPALARELVDFLVPRMGSIRSAATYPIGVAAAQQSNDFQDYPCLKRHIDSIFLRRQDELPQEFCHWEYNAPAWINVVTETVAKIVSRKGRKINGYKLSGIGQLWLLICATADTTSDRAGPEQACQQRLSKPRIVQAARDSGFDKVFFWESVARWDFEIPNV